MTRSRLELTRAQILAFRRKVGALDERLPRGRSSLRRAAWAGLQDSMPRAALLSIHARVEGPGPSTWEDPSLVQLWGPRYNVFVVAACDLAVFSLGTLPDDARGRRRAQAYLLRYGADRDLLVPDADRRRALWTPRVWPGGVLVGGEIAGTWRRADAVMTVQPWRQVS